MAAATKKTSLWKVFGISRGAWFVLCQLFIMIVSASESTTLETTTKYDKRRTDDIITFAATSVAAFDGKYAPARDVQKDALDSTTRCVTSTVDTTASATSTRLRVAQSTSAAPLAKVFNPVFLTVSEVESTARPALPSIAMEANMTGFLGDHNGTDLIWQACQTEVPSTEELFHDMPKLGYVILAFYVLFVVFTIGIYIEELIFIKANFKDRDRRRRTMWVLTLFPVYSFTAFIGALIPRAATIVNLCASAFFGTCLVQLLELMVNYMGGLRRMWKLIGEDKMIAPQTLPLCCCCLCLPKYMFTRKRFIKLSIMVIQVAIIRPLLMFIASALWANGTYHPGKISPWNAYLYITSINLLSTIPAMYGLMQLRNGFLPELDAVKIRGKVFIIQLAMITTVAINLVVGILTHNGVVICSSVLPAPARGSVIYHGLIITFMVPYSLIARLVYRRESDGTFIASPGECREELAFSHYDNKAPNNNSHGDGGEKEEKA